MTSLNVVFLVCLIKISLINAVSADSQGNIYYFGGLRFKGSYRLNQLWFWNRSTWTLLTGSTGSEQGGTYGPLNAASHSYTPGARSNHNAWVDKYDNFYLFGGYGESNVTNQIGFLNDLWRWNSSGWSWIAGSKTLNAASIKSSGASFSNSPGGRSSAIQWKDNDDNIWIFGGAVGFQASGDTTPINDLWKFSSSGWEYIGGPQTGNDPGTHGAKGTFDASYVPAARYKAATWVGTNNNLYLYGGYGNSFFADAWCFDTSISQWAFIAGSLTTDHVAIFTNPGTPCLDSSDSCNPGSRAGGASWTDAEGNFWLFAGDIFIDSNSYFGQDLWKMQVVSPTEVYWTWVDGTNQVNSNGIYTKDVNTSMPGGRHYFAYSNSGPYFYIFGGEGYGSKIGVRGMLNDIWLINTNASRPIESLTTTGSNPDETQKSTSSGKGSNVAVIIASVVSIIGAIAIIAAIVILILWRRKSKNSKSSVYLDRIEIKERIGGGNFGDVYRGIWLGTTEVALKKSTRTGNMDDFYREAESLQHLNHPNLIRYLGLYEKADYYIVMEYLPLGSLDNYIRENEKKLSHSDLFSMAKGAAAGMKYLEALKYIHRDLALRNLLVSKDENNKFIVKVSDFGLTRKLENSYYTSENKEIPVKWCSPEVLKHGKYSIKSDVWAFGVVLWEIFSYGTLPYTGIANSEVYAKLKSGYRMEPPEKCPEFIVSLIDACWQENADDRPTFDDIFNDLDQMAPGARHTKFVRTPVRRTEINLTKEESSIHYNN